MTDAPSYTCAGCGGPVPPERSVKIFCGERCRQEASYVRYVRRCRREGRINEPGIIDILKIRLSHIANGGYPERQRRMADSLRKKIFKRDDGVCIICGKQGVDIDHIDGSSNDPLNLQLLCKECHVKKTLANLRTFEPGSPAEDAFKKCEAALEARIIADPPLRECDDDLQWEDISLRLQLERNVTKKRTDN